MKKDYWHEFIPKSIICLRDNYNWSTFRKDLIAGITVGIVALPLAMAFAMASGVDPERGLYTAIIAGFLIAFLGGTRVQIGGPTGAFVVVVYDVVQRHGYEGLLMATLIAGVMLLIMGFSRLGNLIKYIPYPLITGFTSGIAVIIFSSQMKDFFGLDLGTDTANFLQKWKAIIFSFHSWDAMTCSVGLGTLGIILAVRRFFPVLPWGIASIVFATIICTVFQFPVETVADRFGEIPRTLPQPSFPEFIWDMGLIRALLPDALVIALLAGIESLLSAVIADGMTGGRHKSNCELVAQGMANLGAVFFGGMPATAAIARTATNIKSGAQTPMAGMIHALTLLLIMAILAPIVSLIPLPALSAVLIMIAWNMFEVQHFCHLLKAPFGDVAVLLTAFFLTVLIDITVAVEVGMGLAAFLFMKRMSDLSGIVTPLLKETVDEFPEKNDPDAISKKEVPPQVEVFEINGPLFFGVSDRLKNVLHNMEFPPKVFILRMRRVPIIDASGVHALREFHQKCKKEGTVLILSGVQPALLSVFKKFGFEKELGEHHLFPHIDAALEHARKVTNLLSVSQTASERVSE